MSREYQAKDKTFSKMTRDGLVERNAVTDEERRVSGRERDFGLRQGQPAENRQSFRHHQVENPPPRSAPDRYRRQPEPSNTEQTADAGQNIHHNTIWQNQSAAAQTEPQNTAEPERELPMEAAQPTARSYEARSYETPAGGRPSPKQYGGYRPQNSGNKYNNGGKLHRQRYQPNQQQNHQTGNQNGNTPPPAQSQPSHKTQAAPTYHTPQAATPATPHKPPHSSPPPAPPPRPKDPERQGKLQFSQDSKSSNQPPQRNNHNHGGKHKKHNHNRKPYYNDHNHNRQGGQQAQRQPQNGQKPSIRPHQHGTQYSQQFDPKAAKDTSAQKPNTQTPPPNTQQAQPAAAPVQSPPTPPPQAPKHAPNPPNPEPVKPPSSSQPVTPEKPGRLRFNEDDKVPAPDKKLMKAQDKSKQAKDKLDKARGKLPENRKPNDKNRRRLRFEQDGSSIVTRGADSVTRFGTDTFHRKLHEVENENVGVKAAHTAQKTVEESARRGLQFVKNRPYQKAARLERKSIKADNRYAKTVRSNTKNKAKSNAASRKMQKRKIKKQYAQAAKKAKKTGQTLKQTGNTALKAVKAVTGFITRHPHILIIIAIAALLAVAVSSCVAMFGGGMPAAIASSYLAEDADIDNAELFYTEWETDLLLRIENIDTEYPGYDEYRYNIGSVGHDPYQMMAFLTAMFQNFQYSSIETYLQALFAEQYQLTLTPVTETRYRPVYDSETGLPTGESEPYDWYVLVVTLTTKPLSAVITPYMATEQAELYELLMMTHGNRQYAKSPFSFNWLPNVSCNYGYRVHPISGVKDYHAGVDIAVPVGTDIQSAQDGTVTFAGYNGGYGYVVVIENNNGLITKYAHCDTLSVSAGQTVKAGDLIAKSGNTGNSTGPHLHFEVIKNGQYLNPAYFSETGG